MSHSQKVRDSEIEYCEFCGKQFIPNKYNPNRQKYCTCKKCRKERRKASNAIFRDKNPDYYKKTPTEQKEKTYRTKVYNQQRQQKRQLESLTKRVIKQQKRVIVDHSQSLVSYLNFYFSTFLGMVAYSSGGLRQSSALSTGNLLDLFYKDGVSIIGADKNLKQTMEVLNEFITKSDQCVTTEEFAKILQLD